MSDVNNEKGNVPTVQEYVDSIMADWPEPSDELRRRIAAIFNG